jgi:hypothetical protein
MLSNESRRHWFGSRLAAGSTIAAASGLVIGVLFTTSAIGAGDFRDFIVFTGVAVVLAAVLGGPIACAVLCLLLGKENPWELWPALALATVASTFVALAFPLYLGPLSCAFTAFIGGTAAAIAIRVFARR